MIRRIPVFIGAILLVLLARPEQPGIFVGIALIAMGEMIRIWAVGHLQKNEALTVTGPYAHVKNPLYVGTILITGGFCVLASNVYLMAAAMFGFCFHYIPYKKRVEGARLRRIFGKQYEDYDESVPDYLPRLRPYSKRKAPWQFKCFIANSEGGILLLNVIGILAILSRPHWDRIF